MRHLLLVVWVLVGGTGCVFDDMLNQGAARMAIMAAGQVTGLAGLDEDCGFSSVSTLLLDISSIEPTDDGAFRTSWDVADCRVGSEERHTDTNCVGDELSVRGAATITGSQVVTLEAALPPRPAGAHAVHLAVTDAHLYELEMENAPANDPDTAAVVTVHEGRVSVELEPVLGESASDPGSYMVPTPIARMSHVHLRNADMTVVAQGQTVDLHVDDSDLTATSGPFGHGAENHIEGTITIDGEDVKVDGELEEGLSRKTFDARYACEDDLAAPVR